jgi:predicted RecA/RadA family phage recombinase
MAHQLISEGRFINYTPSGADVVAGQVVALTNHFGIAPRAIADGELGSLDTQGEWELTKLAGAAYTLGQTIYWDAANSRLTSVAGSLKKIGVATQAAASGDTVARIKLNATHA